MNRVYIQEYLKNFQEKIPAGTDYEKEFPNMVIAIIGELQRQDKIKMN